MPVYNVQIGHDPTSKTPFLLRLDYQIIICFDSITITVQTASSNNL